MTVPNQPPIYYGCSNVTESYKPLGKIGEGTFGEVFRAEQIATGRHVALKKILLHSEKEGFPVTALREIRILKLLRHENVIPLVDLAVERGDQSKKERGCVYMVTPYMDHDLAGLLGNKAVQLSMSHIKCYMLQLLEGIGYLHAKKFLHRDIKAANILVNDQGILKLADFGLARGYDGPVPNHQTAGQGTENLTAMVVTRWYRPPELILGDRKYTTAIDMWGIGCVFGEFFTRKPIFPGSSDVDQGVKIFQAVGAPTEETMPGWSVLPGASNSNMWGTDPTNKLDKMFPRLTPDALDLLKQLLLLDSTKRLTALGGKDHAYFKTEPLPCLPHQLPRFPSSHELDNHKRRAEGREAANDQQPRDSREPPPRDGKESARDSRDFQRDPPRDYPRRGPPQGRYDSFERPDRRPEGPREPSDGREYDSRDRDRSRGSRDYPPPRDRDRRPPPPRHSRDYPPPRNNSRDSREYSPPRDRERDRERDRDRDRERDLSPSRQRFHKRPQFDMYSDSDYDREREDDERRRRQRDIYVPSRVRERDGDKGEDSSGARERPLPPPPPLPRDTDEPRPGPPLPPNGPPPPPSSQPPRAGETYGSSRPPWRRGAPSRDSRDSYDSRDSRGSRYDDYDNLDRKRPRRDER